MGANVLKQIMGYVRSPLPPVLLGKSVLSYVTKSRLLGRTILVDTLTWILHTLELKKNFAKKIEALKIFAQSCPFKLLF